MLKRSQKSVFALVITILSVAIGASESDQQLAVFDEVWERVNSTYYDENFGDANWAEIGKRYRDQLSDVESIESFRGHLEEMLNELGESHFSIVRGSFSGVVQQKRGGGVSGIELTQIDKKFYIFRISRSEESMTSGLFPGYRIWEINGKRIDEIRKEVETSGIPRHLVNSMILDDVEQMLSGRVGEEIVVKAGRSIGSSRNCKIRLERYDGLESQAFGNVPKLPIEIETRELPGNVAYLRFNLWFPSIMSELRAYVKSLEGKTSGLIIDLRGNRGGIGLMASGLSGLLVSEDCSLGTMSMREGHVNFLVYPQKGAYTGPIAILVDERSLSTSEIFAAGLQELGRATIVGTRTSGATLPSQFFGLSNGDYLQMPMADFKTPMGILIEGKGVYPDRVVRLSAKRLRKAEDNVIESARQLLLDSR